MKSISEMAEKVADELDGAKCYAQDYLMLKAKENSRASQYKQMATEELSHATNLHSFLVEDIELLKKTYTPPEEMQEKWNKEHRCYIEKKAWIKQMLSM